MSIRFVTLPAILLITCPSHAFEFSYKVEGFFGVSANYVARCDPAGFATSQATPTLRAQIDWRITTIA